MPIKQVSYTPSVVTRDKKLSDEKMYTFASEGKLHILSNGDEISSAWQDDVLHLFDSCDPISSNILFPPGLVYCDLVAGLYVFEFPPTRQLINYKGHTTDQNSVKRSKTFSLPVPWMSYWISIKPARKPQLKTVDVNGSPVSAPVHLPKPNHLVDVLQLFRYSSLLEFEDDPILYASYLPNILGGHTVCLGNDLTNYISNNINQLSTNELVVGILAHLLSSPYNSEAFFASNSYVSAMMSYVSTRVVGLNSFDVKRLYDLVSLIENNSNISQDIRIASPLQYWSKDSESAAVHQSRIPVPLESLIPKMYSKLQTRIKKAHASSVYQTGYPTTDMTALCMDLYSTLETFSTEQILNQRLLPLTTVESLIEGYNNNLARKTPSVLISTIENL